MLTDPTDFHPVMGNWPRNREDLNRHAWQRFAPSLLALMPAGDPGPVPEYILDDYRVDEDENEAAFTMADVDEDELDFGPHTITDEDIAEALGRVSAEDSLAAYLNDGPAARARAARGHIHAEPTETVRRHLRLVK